MITYSEFYENYKPDLRTYEDFKKTEYAEIKDFEREKILKLLLDEEYGHLKNVQYKTEFELVNEEKWLSGNIIKKELRLNVVFEDETAQIPFVTFVPVCENKCPAFLFISFESVFPNKYCPVEEICDNGFAITAFGYKDVADDKDDGFISCLERHFIGKREEKTAGKICLWSTVAIMLMDYMQTVDEIDKENIAVAGHSRLGKTALLTGARDTRFKYTISNNSGCGGAALSFNKRGESIEAVNTCFPYWFSLKYREYINNEDKLEFDQHFLLSLIAPRYLYVASSSLDGWADPNGEYYSCVLADKVYKAYGKKGFVHPERFPIAGEELHEGTIGYHLKDGNHSLSRYDWSKYIKFIKGKMNNDKEK